MTIWIHGTQLSWEEIKQVAEQMRRIGIAQLIYQWKNIVDISTPDMLWGDEIEYMLIHFDDEKKEASLNCCVEDLLRIVSEPEMTRESKKLQIILASRATNGSTTNGKKFKSDEDGSGDHPRADSKHCDKAKKQLDKRVGWHPEYTAWSIEGTQVEPYSAKLSSVLELCEHLKLRRHDLDGLFAKNEALITVSNFPRLGCPEFIFPRTKPTPGKGMTGSIFVPDISVFDGCGKMLAEARNLGDRRGTSIACNVPIFVDKNTQLPFYEDLKALGDKNGVCQREALANHIFLDAVAFGGGCCSLQVTMQAPDLNGARWLYDQLAVLGPIALALAAACPFFRGYVADIDSRWIVYADCIDDRTEEERGLKPLDESKYKIDRTRYSSIECYLAEGARKYQDREVVKDEKYYQQLMASGIDEEMAMYVAHLFLRDPIQAVKEQVEQSTETSFGHFLNIQGTTNWPVVRLKFPLDEECKQTGGWRTEFRVMETSLTDFENAAFSTFIYLLARAILKYKLELRIPISKLQANINEAVRRDACRRSVFHFRRLTKIDDPTTLPERIRDPHEKVLDDYYMPMSVDEIVNGTHDDRCIGLMNIVRQYLREEAANESAEVLQVYEKFLTLVSLKAAGKLDTTATWQRKFVQQHPLYKQDSRVSAEIVYDLMKVCREVSSGERVEKSLCPFQL